MYTLVKIKSGKHYKSLIIHKGELGIYNINNRESLITYTYIYIYELIGVVNW